MKMFSTIYPFLLVIFVNCQVHSFRRNWYGSMHPGWQRNSGPRTIGLNPEYYSPVGLLSQYSNPLGRGNPFWNNASDSNPVVVLRDGGLRGFKMRTATSREFNAFQGIPFAQSPVGALRFQDPRRNLPWVGIRDAIAQSPQCIQIDLMRQYDVHGQEDCLFLNVYTPQLPTSSELNGYRKKLPVMIWIHGGAFFFGAGSIYGPAYLLDQDIVLVTFNYRLGPFGFLSTGDDASPGNQGLKDQVLAMKWVKENIQKFGGDPNSVTLFGESAGAGSVGHHIVSQMSRGLFHRGISQSGSSMCYWSFLENAPATTRRVGSLLNCTGTSHQIVNCMRNLDAQIIAPIQLQFAEWNAFPLVIFAPVIEHNHPGAFLTQSPKDAYKQNRAASVPWITGFNKDELVWLVSALILDPTTVADINNDWDRISPIFLGLGNTTEINVQAGRKIWEFYMGNNNFSFETRHEFANLFGDRYLLECGLEAMRYHSRFTGQPVYGYQLSYQGQYSIVQQVGQSPQDWGVSHLDDLIYLLNNTDYYPTLQPNEEEFQMSQMMTSIWSNFATYGRPYITSGGQLRDIWQPIPQSVTKFSPIRLLDLNLSPKMIDDPYVARYKFWKSLYLD